MDSSVNRFLQGDKSRSGNRLQFSIAVFGLSAPVLTFLVAVSPLTASTKVAILVALSFIYFLICLWTIWQLRQPVGKGGTVEEQMADSFASAEDLLEGKLAALEDAREFFGSSLKPADMFRLVASRIGEIVPFSSAAIFMRSSKMDFLLARHAFGANALLLENSEIPIESSLAGLALLGGEIATSSELGNEALIYPEGSLAGFSAAAAVPLSQDGDVFAVLQFYFSEPLNDSAELITRLEIIGERLAPLFLGSLAYERSLSSALTDPLTKLPNERAFYLVLENQLAESQRFRDERPLTVLAVDIRDFEEINRDYGHSTGDRVLGFAAAGITSQLRRMDFLARSMNDEFLIVLPKASARTASEIIERIAKHFSNHPFEFSGEETARIWLNFGWANFWQDGETAEQLLNAARQRKQLSKLGDLSNVLKFPKEYVN